MESLFIDGEYVQSESAEAIGVENPATEEHIADVPDADTADVDRWFPYERPAIDEREIAGAKASSV